jgi:hypothetical protein
MPCFLRCEAITTTSPNHEGKEGRDSEVVWIFTELLAVLVFSNSLFPYLLNTDVSQRQFQKYTKKACDVRGKRIDARRVMISQVMSKDGSQCSQSLNQCATYYALRARLSATQMTSFRLWPVRRCQLKNSFREHLGRHCHLPKDASQRDWPAPRHRRR